MRIVFQNSVVAAGMVDNFVHFMLGQFFAVVMYKPDDLRRINYAELHRLNRRMGNSVIHTSAAIFRLRDHGLSRLKSVFTSRFISSTSVAVRAVNDFITAMSRSSADMLMS